MKLSNKVAIITGSARGIGKAIALKFASEGAAVVVNALHSEGIRSVVQEIQDRGEKAIAFRADVSKKEEVQDMVEYTLKNFGAIHILVNNAGIARHRPILEIEEEDWNITMDVNLKSVFLCTQAVLDYMMEQGYGKIINISSISGLVDFFPGAAAYGAAKAGVMALTKFTAIEAGTYGINVNCIAPGRIVTDMIYKNRGKEGAKKFIADGKKLSVLGRVGYPEDIADLALFLASDSSSFMTGQIIRSDGGRTDLM